MFQGISFVRFFFFCAGCGIHYTTVQATVIITVQSAGQEQLWLHVHTSVSCALDKHKPQNCIWDPVLQEGSSRNALSWCFRLCQSVRTYTHSASWNTNQNQLHVWTDWCCNPNRGQPNYRWVSKCFCVSDMNRLQASSNHKNNWLFVQEWNTWKSVEEKVARRSFECVSLKDKKDKVWGMCINQVYLSLDFVLSFTLFKNCSLIS